jgi:hypothetical protein
VRCCWSRATSGPCSVATCSLKACRPSAILLRLGCQPCSAEHRVHLGPSGLWTYTTRWETIWDSGRRARSTTSGTDPNLNGTPVLPVRSTARRARRTALPKATSTGSLAKRVDAAGMAASSLGVVCHVTDDVTQFLFHQAGGTKRTTNRIRVRASRRPTTPAPPHQ